MVIWKNDALFQTLFGTVAYDGFGACMELSTDTHTLLVGAAGFNSGHGAVAVYRRSTTVDQFRCHHTLKGEKAYESFGNTIAMIPNGLAVAVTAHNAIFGRDRSRSVYFYMRYTSNDEFDQVGQVNGG